MTELRIELANIAKTAPNPLQVQRPAPTAIVVGFADRAAALQRQLDPTRTKFHVIYAGQQIMGMRFSDALLTDNYHYGASKMAYGRRCEWLDYLSMRLRGGSIVDLT